ncbi:MAG: MipA/OmpV family protein [Pseudomonadales bacterium]
MNRLLSLLRAAPLLTITAADTACAESHWLLGMGLYTERSSYVGQSNSPAPFPYLAYETERWHIGLDALSYQVWNSERSTLTVLAEPQFGISDPGQNDIDQRLERDATIDAGFEWRLQAGRWFVEANASAELTQEHRGYQSGIAFGWDAELGKAAFELTVQSSWRDRRLSAYLYGIGVSEASTTLPAYSPGSTWGHRVEASIALPLTDRSLGIFQLGISHLDQAATNSPRIDSRVEPSLLIGWLWRF